MALATNPIKTLLFGGRGGGDLLAEIGLLVLRVVSGLFLVVGHGWGKMTNPGPFIENAVTGTFPLPSVMGWFAILGEVVGGILLAVGFFTRPAALWVIGVFFGAAFITHGSAFTGEGAFWLPQKGAVEPALLYLVIGVTFLLTGSGRTGLDQFARR